ncbi:DUF3857 domain-containing protein [Winogradskyella litoriviva]|uniref:DUF3857 domain-containing protein n=1 Tax=Winogradskyella litoriviva TaxID=1220182 RepID=A0ABX2E515_9FLAO|nr:DUF3857 domain-containing protein [Winogradskyella litoriviva]NRD23379.1 DUF3857 domain-containing protein [Winogradskyella litoriviva]
MNQLFLKNKKYSIIIICSFALFFSFKPNFKNNSDDPFTELCKNADAYYLYSYTDISYAKSWARYKTYISVSNKLVVNSIKGVENYAFLNLDEYESNHLKSIKIKTLKADGSIVELDSSKVFFKNSKGKKFSAINYPIPAVEPGDTIETNYVYYKNLRQHELMNFVNLYRDIPSINSQFTVRTGPELSVRYKSYNNFPKPAIVANDTMVYVQFSMDKLKGQLVNDHNCLPCEKPYIYYSLEEKDSELRTWKDVYNQEFNFLTQPMALDYDNSSYYKRWKRRVIGTAKDSSKYHKFKLLHSAVLDNFKVEPINDSEFIKSTGYFLKEQRFDAISIRRFYRQILEDLDIKYWAVFSRTKRAGKIDAHYIRKGEFDHIFFAYENEKGFLKFLYPHEDFYMYQIDEIPTSIYGTEAIIVKPYFEANKKRKDKFINRDLELAEVDSVSVAKINLPEMDANHNYIIQSISSNINIDKKTTSFRYKFKISGGLSTDVRTFFEMLNENEDASNFYEALSDFEGNDNTLEIDTITDVIFNRNKPFSYTMNGNGTLNNVVSFINDSLVSVSVNKLIQHNEIETITDTSELDYYLDYSYSDNLFFDLNFPCDIEVVGLDNKNVDFKNEYGEYFFKIMTSNNNQLRFNSKYRIIQNLIPKENYEELKRLNEKIKIVKNMRLIIKLKQ